MNCKLCGFMEEAKEVKDKRGKPRKIRSQVDCRKKNARK